MAVFARFALVFALFAAIAFAATDAHGFQTSDAPRLVERRAIELPDSRLIGLSPDGSAIAATDIGIDELCIYDAETLAERACADLAPLEAGLRFEDVAWSPDSSTLALTEHSFRLFRDGDLWLMDATTGALTNLTDDGVNGNIPFGDREAEFDELFLDVAPTWLPDASGVTFSRSIWRNGDFAGNQIVTVPVGGGVPALLTTVTPDTPGVVYFGMRWTADGSRLYYAVNHPDQGYEQNGIWRVNADGSGAEKLAGVDSVLGLPVLGGISPDGDTVLLYYLFAAGATGVSTGNLYALLDVPSGTMTSVTLESVEAPEVAGVWPATLSPDGRYVLYATRVTDPEFQIIVESVDGGVETNLVPEGLPGAATIDLAAPLIWSATGHVLINGPDFTTATLLTIEGGADFEPDRPGANASPVGPDARNEPITPAALAGAFEPGATVIVNTDGVLLWTSPNVDGQLAAILAFGTELVVVGAYESESGELWVAVTDPETGVIGYVRAEYLDPEE